MSLPLVDLVAQALAGSGSRRAGLRAAVTAAAAAFSARAAAADAAPGGQGPCGGGGQKDNTCAKDADCCTGICKLPGKDAAAAAGKGGRGRKGKGKHGKGKHRAPSGRCRCLGAGKPCAEDRNCCSDMRCKDGACRHERAAGPVRLGRPCTGKDTCADDRATCTAYQWGERAGTGTYCLLATGDACTGNQQCPTDRCLGGVCAPCSVPACGAACSPIVCAGGCEFATVQAAIDARQGTASSIVDIGAGTWEENLQVTGDVTLRGCPGAETILRNASYLARTVSATGPASLTVLDIIIDGYSDKNGGSFGGGLYGEGDITIAGEAVIRNAAWDKGAGIYLAGPGRALTITDNAVIENNGCSNRGGGALVEGESALVVSGSAILRDNLTDSYGGALAAVDGATVAISGAVTIENNTGGGAGLLVYRGISTRPIPVVVEGDVVIRDNNATGGNDGGFVRFQNVGNGDYHEMDIHIRDRVKITGNSATGDGGAISSRWGKVTVSGSVELSGNQSADDGGAFWVAAAYSGPWPEGVVGLSVGESVVVSGNTAASVGGGVSVRATTFSLSGSATITGNTGNDGGGVSLGSYSGWYSTLAISGAASVTGNTANGSGGGLWSDNAGNSVTGGAAVTGNTPDNCAGSGISCA